MREPGVQMEPEPEWSGPDPLIEMARKARRMVPASKVAEAVSAERARIRAEGNAAITRLAVEIKNNRMRQGVQMGGAAVLAIVNREDTEPKRDYLADASLAALDRALDREDTDAS